MQGKTIDSICGLCYTCFFSFCSKFAGQYHLIKWYHLFIIHFTLEISTFFNVFIEDKLSSVDKEYGEKQKLVQWDKNQAMEERLIAMQKKYELQKKDELQEEVLI